MIDTDSVCLVAFGASSVAAVVCSAVLSLVRTRLSRPGARGFVLAAIVLVFVAVPFLFDWLVLNLNTTSGLARVYIDPSPVMVLTPSILGGVAAVVVALRARRRRV